MNCKNYCDQKGNCTRCGNCCAAMLPLTKKEENEIREYIKKNNIEPEFFQNEKELNIQCCFYDRTNKKCKIYDVRPNICKSFKCNKNTIELEKERDIAHKKAYWNGVIDGKIGNIADMRLLFYNDPRTLIAYMIYEVTNGSMKCDEKQFKWIKDFFRKHGQEELASCIEEKYYEQGVEGGVRNEK